MNAKIRKAQQEDLEAIRVLNHKLFLWDKDRDPDLNFAWPLQEEGEKYFRRRIDGKPGVCFVAEVSGEIVGYIAGRVNENIDSTETVLRGEIENIYVEEHTQGMGVGKSLVKNFVEWTASNNAQSMVVTAYYGNKQAIKFYEACGFSPFALKLEMKIGASPT